MESTKILNWSFFIAFYAVPVKEQLRNENYTSYENYISEVCSLLS